jgi:CRP-like cAMP-binding protein
MCLARVSLFSMLPKKELARLAREADDRRVPAGAVLTAEEGARLPASSWRAAAVSVRGRPARILGPDDYFGAMALIGRSYRSATVTAATELRCLLFVAWGLPSFCHAASRDGLDTAGSDGAAGP